MEDGGGLYLNVAQRREQIVGAAHRLDGRRRDVGLGGFPAVSLAKARERASENRDAIADGRDPVAEKRTPKPAMPTFREAARACHEMNRPRWRNEKHAANWLATLERHAMPKLGQLAVDRITGAAVLAVLTPIWGTRQETARRVRQRVRAVMRWAVAHGHRDDNPAGEGIDGALPPHARDSGSLPRPTLQRGAGGARDHRDVHGGSGGKGVL